MASQTMKAVTQLGYGITNETIVVKDAPYPALITASNNVVIRVHAASINPIDYKLARGDFKLIYGRTFPHVCGFDVAGTVVEVGSKCTRIKVGDEVFGDILDLGSMAEYAAAPEVHFVVKPKNLTFEEAATIPLAGLTAYQVC